MSMNKFAKAVKKETALSPLIEGKDKLTCREIKDTYPSGVTVVGFDMVPMKNKNSGETEAVPVLTFAEDKNSFFFGGELLRRIVERWIDDYNGDIDTANAELVKAGGVKLVLEDSKTKSGNNFTSVHLA